MNDKSQIEYHKDKVMLLGFKLTFTEDGYQAECSTCPWTSGIRDTELAVTILYYKHLEYIGKGLNA